MTRTRRVERPIVPMLAAILVGVYLWKFWHPVPTNANFSWQMRSGWPSGRVLATLLSSGTAVVCVLAFARLAQTSLPDLVVLPGLVMAVLAACFMGWLLYPTVCDKRERFLARPNETCRCLGVTA